MDDHPLHDPLKIQARHVAENSIVRLPDGRVGYLTHKTGTQKPWVVVKPGHLAVEVNRTDALEVLCCPLRMAITWLETYHANCHPEQCPEFTEGLVEGQQTNQPIYPSTTPQELTYEPPT
jgi:hypothetical protein